MEKVNFFIVGAAKSGTTSIHSYLKEHPEIYMLEPKEINYYVKEEVESQGLFFQGYVAQTKEEYEKIRSKGDDYKAVGEASVSYLFYEKAPHRIKRDYPNAKILIFLRNPADRAYSHYLMDHRIGHVSTPFKYIVNQTEHSAFGSLYYQQYIKLGFYHDQVKRYVDVFGEKNVCIMLDEDLKQDLQGALVKIFLFLQVSAADVNPTPTHQNIFFVPKTRSTKFLYKIYWLRKALKIFLPDSVIEKLKSSKLSDKNKPLLDDKTRKTLIQMYYNDVSRLEQLIDRELAHWKQ